MDRFLQRVKVFEERLEGRGDACVARTDQLLYEEIMEALGYSKNKKQFLELARRVPLEVLAGQPPEKIQAVLFGVAGLLPPQARGRGTQFDAETEDYVSKIQTLWKPFSSQFKGKLMSGEEWEFFRIRPENFPTKRIAGMSYILSNCRNADKNSSTSLLAMFLSALAGTRGGVSILSKTSRQLRDMLMPRVSGYWTSHYTFGGRRHKQNLFLIGQNRAADIVVNVILPAVLAHARKSRDEELQQAVMEVYVNHPRLQDNKITRYVTDRIFRDGKECSSLVNSAMRQQGLILLYKSFCTTRNCQNCPLMEESV